MSYIILLATLIIAFGSLFVVFKDKITALFGAILYVCMPYSIFITFDTNNWGKTLFRLILPLIYMSIAKIYSKKDGNKLKISYLWIISSVLLLSISSKFDCILLVILCGIILLLGVILKKYIYIPIAFAGLLGSFFVNINFWKFILLGTANTAYVENALISSKGYYVGDYIMCFMYKEGHPGIGIGLLFSICIILWYLMSNENTQNEKKYNILFFFSIFVAFFSFHHGAWDIAERIHPIVERFISSIGSPNVFFGFACELLCIPSAVALKRLWDEKTAFVSKTVPIFALIMNCVAAIFQIIK